MVFINKKSGQALIIFSIFLLLIFALTVKINGNTDENKLTNFARVDKLHQEIIDLVLKSSSTLESQQNLVNKYQEIIIPEKRRESTLDLDADLTTGLEEGKMFAAPKLGFNLSFPIWAADESFNQLQEELTFLDTKTTQKQKLEKIEKEIVSDLNRQLENLIAIVNKNRGQKKLIETLRERSREIRDLIDAGITEPDKLWELDERINEIEIEMANLQSQQLLIINEIASNFGGNNREEMKEKLNKIIMYIKDGDNHG